MIITRHNYEEYFLLYVDNELSIQERRMVDAFVKENGDLEEELTMLKQSVLRPDKSVVFQNKGQLIRRSTGMEPINELNYAEYFVLYGDDELSTEENDMVEQFVYRHPQYQTEFELILQARFTPDTSIVFPNKESLYRKEKETRVIRITWMRIAAAAIVLLFAGAVGWNYFFSGSQGNGTKTGTGQTQEVAITNEKKTPTESSTETKTDSGTAAPFVAQNTDQVKSKKENAVRKTHKEKINSGSKDAKDDIVYEGRNFKGMESNLSTVKTVTPIETGTLEPDKMNGTTIAKAPIDIPVDLEKTGERLNKNDVVKAGFAMNTEDDLEVLNTSVKKNTSRGFFRKVSRVVGSVTNLGPKDRETSKGKGLRIANVEIGLK